MQYYYENDPRMILGLQDELIDIFWYGRTHQFFKERKILYVLDKAMRRHQSQNPGNVVVSMGLNEHLVQINDYYGLIDSIKNVHQLMLQKYRKLWNCQRNAISGFLRRNLWLIQENLLKPFRFLSKRTPLIETLMILSQSSNAQYAEAILSRYSRIRNAVMFLAVSYVLYDLLVLIFYLNYRRNQDSKELSLPLFCQIMRHKLK